MHTGDKGQPREELQGIEEFSGIDFSLLEDDWTSKKGDFGTGVTSSAPNGYGNGLGPARRRKSLVSIVLVLLTSLCKPPDGWGRSVVAHGGILGMITGTWVRIESFFYNEQWRTQLSFLLKGWGNCEGEHQRQCCSILQRDHFAVRQYTFKSADDEEADIIPIKVEAPVGPVGPASSEQALSQ